MGFNSAFKELMFSFHRYTLVRHLIVLVSTVYVFSLCVYQDRSYKAAVCPPFFLEQAFVIYRVYIVHSNTIAFCVGLLISSFRIFNITTSFLQGGCSHKVLGFDGRQCLQLDLPCCDTIWFYRWITKFGEKCGLDFHC